VGQRDADAAVGLLDGVRQGDAGDRQADRRDECRGGDREADPPGAPPRPGRGDGRSRVDGRRGGDDGAHVSTCRCLVDRPHVGAADRVGEGRVEFGLVVRRHGQASG
jgi:hypothetical protein